MRITPITGKPQMPAEHHRVADAVVKVFGRIRGPFWALLHSPALAERILPLVNFFRDENIVDPKLRSIAILTAVRERDALRKRYSERWLVEMPAAASYYVFVSGIANAFEVPPPEDGDRLPAQSRYFFRASKNLPLTIPPRKLAHA